MIRCSKMARDKLTEVGLPVAAASDFSAIACNRLCCTRSCNAAPVYPFVSFASWGKERVSFILMVAQAFCKISKRLFSSGKGSSSCSAKRPGRSTEGSSRSGRLVAARIRTSRPLSPSISAKNWLTIRLAAYPSLSLPLRRGRKASNSSKNSKHGASCRAFRKISRMLRSESPSHLEKSSGPLTVIQFTFPLFS